MYFVMYLCKYELLLFIIATLFINLQMLAFRSLLINRRAETDVYLQDNFRPIQALGDRTVYTGDIRAITTSASGVSTYSVILFLGCLLFVCC